MTAGTLTRVVGALAEATGLAGVGLNELVRVGDRRLLGEVLRVSGHTAMIQVFEDTTGVRLGEPVVREGRPNLSTEQIKKLADGRIYSGEQAKQSGLVDEIGYLDEAVDLAKKKAGLTAAKVITYRRPGEYQNNVYSRLMGNGAGVANLANLDLLSLVRGGTPQFMYLWMP